jgi:GDP-mannose 6-dehydrogenase
MGHTVVGVDVNTDKVRTLNAGRSPILEPGVEELVRAAVEAGALSATADAEEAVAQSDVALVCVGTPSQPNGSLDLTYVERVMGQIGRAMAETGDHKVVVLRSTVLPGSLRSSLVPILEEAAGRRAGEGFGVAVNPEFLREGSAVRDFSNPPFTIIGAWDAETAKTVEGLYDGLVAPVIHTDPDSACLVKYASNAFHALKVTFANEIGRVCKSLGVDGTSVMEIFCKDTSLNISPRYLKPGFAFGGSCLPKDLRALLHLARHRDLELPVLEAILPSNRLQVGRVVDMVLRDGRQRVGVVGLSFKPNTDDLRESPVVDLVETLTGKGLEVAIWDDNVNLSRLTGGNRAFIERVLPHVSALMRPTLQEVVEESDVLVVAHALNGAQERLGSLLRPDHLVIDLARAFEAGSACPAPYEGICW